MCLQLQLLYVKVIFTGGYMVNKQQPGMACQYANVLNYSISQVSHNPAKVRKTPHKLASQWLQKEPKGSSDMAILPGTDTKTQACDGIVSQIPTLSTCGEY